MYWTQLAWTKTITKAYKRLYEKQEVLHQERSTWANPPERERKRATRWGYVDISGKDSSRGLQVDRDL